MKIGSKYIKPKKRPLQKLRLVAPLNVSPQQSLKLKRAPSGTDGGAFKTRSVGLKMPYANTVGTVPDPEHRQRGEHLNDSECPRTEQRGSQVMQSWALLYLLDVFRKVH